MSRPPIDERTTMSRTTVNGMGGLIDFADGGGGGFFTNAQAMPSCSPSVSNMTPSPAVMGSMTPSPAAMASMNGYTYQPNFTNVGMSATDPMTMAASVQQQQHMQNMMMMQASANANAQALQAAHMAQVAQTAASMNPFHMPHPYTSAAAALAPPVPATSVPSVIAGPPSELYMNGKVYKVDGSSTTLATGVSASTNNNVPQTASVAPFVPVIPDAARVSSEVLEDRSLNERVAKKVNEVLQKSKGLYPGLGGSMNSSSRCDDDIDFTQELKRLNKKFAEKISGGKGGEGSLGNNLSNNGKKGRNRY